ncbi:hypothetical protein GCM10007894_04460 [Paraferrimonas haliotis]|uniref:Phage shock protein PspC N-terminal domain-containing protein n=2 Tax=Paraferrimonas haliotis TaxID=2013866 RepID=A0AA37TJV6_9GAMM|nr:hypothetical protein GCM10007894_04460 [Paraferrimonas haliotis]
MNSIRRASRDSWLAGVLSGFANQWGWSRFWVRVVFMCAMLVEPVSLTLGYLILAVLMPSENQQSHYRHR